MAEQKLIISPKTRIGELLKVYPELENVLISMSPAFEKLRNPILRKTVARVATIQQISVVGGISVDSIINRLRRELGQSETETITGINNINEAKPGWLDERNISVRFNATPIINSGESPMSEILKLAQTLTKVQILEFRTPFVPEPILDMLRKKNFLVHSIQDQENVVNYIMKSS